MPTRLWGDAQRARYGRFPEVVDEDDITRCFHLDDHDQTIIAELRGAHNRLGFAVQLGAVRFIGTFPAQTPAVPPVVLDVLARPPDDRHFRELCMSWRRTKRLFEGLLGRVTFEAAPSAEAVRDALAFLANTPNWTKTPMRAAPTACVSAAWRRHVFAGEVKRPAPVADNRAYVFAVLEATRKASKRRDIFVEASGRFADPNRGMLEGAAWSAARPAVLRALGRSEDGRAEINRLREQINAAYQRANANLPHNPDLRFEGDSLVVSHLDRLEESPSLIALRRDIQSRLPKGDLPDILLEVCARTHLADSFTHVSERGARVADFPISLAAVLVAQSCNIGFEPLIRPDVAALRRERLSWVSQNFIRDETLRAADAKLVASHDAVPIVRLWGSGDVASADGVRFVVRGEPIHAGYNPKYFGRKRGVTWYNLVLRPIHRTRRRLPPRHPARQHGHPRPASRAGDTLRPQRGDDRLRRLFRCRVRALLDARISFQPTPGRHRRGPLPKRAYAESCGGGARLRPPVPPPRALTGLDTETTLTMEACR